MYTHYFGLARTRAKCSSSKLPVSVVSSRARNFEHAWFILSQTKISVSLQIGPTHDADFFGQVIPHLLARRPQISPTLHQLTGLRDLRFSHVCPLGLAIVSIVNYLTVDSSSVYSEPNPPSSPQSSSSGKSAVEVERFEASVSWKTQRGSSEFSGARGLQIKF